MERALQNDLLRWRDAKHRKPLILRGARQVGKSWLLKEFGKSFRNYHYVNLEKDLTLHQVFEDLAPTEILRKLTLLSGRTIDTREDLLILDEIQDCPRALTALKYFCEELPALAVCAAGSHIGITFADQSYPVGKIQFLNLFPLSFSEFLKHNSPELFECFQLLKIGELEHNLLSKEFWRYSFTGGMPEAVNHFKEELPAVSAVRNIQQDLLNAYSSDFAKHAGKQNASHILATYENIPKQLHTVYDSSVARFKFKGILPNRSKYSQFKGPIDWLEQTGLILKCRNVNAPNIPLSAMEKENLFKLLYSDIGLLNASLNIDYTSIVNQDYGSYKGFVAESMVAQELKAIGCELRYWKKNDSSSAAEIEFLLESNGEVIPVEVKAGTKSIKSKSLQAFKNKYNPQVSVKLSGKRLRFEEDQVNAPLYLAGKINELISRIRE